MANDLDTTRDGFKLFAAIVEKNVRDANFTTNAIIANLEDQRDAAIRAFIGLYDRLAAIPDFARSMTIDRMLGAYSWDRERYGNALDENRVG